MKTFIKKKENFICENCNHKNKGDGFTNHCSNCLYSKHVDINPGDRENSCQGLMKPIAIEKKNGEERILHKCLKCGFEKPNRISVHDNFDKVIEISLIE